ncbi:MAG: hypothetical protein HY808_01725 [Nitrospirae bacterium]|nr:hypothetical protein [Nitrospirota bacterium]
MLKKKLHLWLPTHIKQALTGCVPAPHPRHIIFAIVDHYEPYWNKASDALAFQRIKLWMQKLPKIAGRFKDADGLSPKHTFFYPEEEYNYECLEMLADISRRGYGDVEIHLHHDNDTADGLRTKLVNFKKILHERHGFLRKDKKTSDILYGFIHGNWALDNSRKDGRWCGVNNEIIILKETGCYADFTLPSAPSDTQTRKINSIYYAKDDPLRPKSHNAGIDVEVGKQFNGDLMIIQGPLTLNWANRKSGIFPRIENGGIAYNSPPNHERLALWIKQHIHVKGRPDWIFVKVYTHGTQERNGDLLLNGGLDKLYTYLGEEYNDGKDYLLHYVSAWEMYNIIKAAEAGKAGNPSEYRNYLMNQ